MSNTITNLSGYQITEILYTGTRTLVYRALRSQDNMPVVIKLLRNEYPTFSELVQFRNQYTIAKNLDYAGIIKPFSLETYGNSYALIMEDFGAISLSDYLQYLREQNQSLSLKEFLEIGIRLTEILRYLYQNRIIHKDIKPANILINPETKEVKLIDFSISSLLPKETQEIQSANTLEGTLAYLSPEQTGRMNRGIDYRSDFYSLGITFYELLTGKLPCVSENPMELVYCHLAIQPPDIHTYNPQIPLVLSEIINKLIAKNVENRYQSSLGIKHDLEQCLNQLPGEIEYFKIAQKDISDSFIIPEKLYGREIEVNQLLTAFDTVSNGITEMLLVAGFSGVGKTALINEVHKPIVRQKGYFIKGKYDQFQRNLPFSAFVIALSDLIGQILSESDSQIQNWQQQILNAVGDNGQVLIDVIPELETLIGKQPPVLELSGVAAQNRFNLLWQKFLQVFTTKEHPLVLFLDDLQWADLASLDLLKLLLTENTGYLLILGAYRDNEVSPTHPLMLTIEEVSKTGATLHTITLKPLTERKLNELVADTLKCELSLAEPLNNLIFQKTQGNPFFATQFLKYLHDEKIIEFEENSQTWQFDIAQTTSLAINSEVVEFVALQIQKLPLPTQNILKLAACIGAQFDLNTLAIISEKSLENAATDLWIALQENLVIPTTHIYKFFTQENTTQSLESSANATYRFLHDRVQQAAYSLIPSEQKQTTHLKIGQLLQDNLSEIETDEKLFEIVSHSNVGIELITQPEEREKLAALNLAAAQKAKNSTAYSAARNFIHTSLKLLNSDCWQTQYQLALDIYTTTTEIAYLNRDYVEMENMAALVFAHAKTILDKVEIYKIQINARTIQSQPLEAIAVAEKAFRELGIEFSSQPDEALTRKALQTVNQQLQDKVIEELLELPLMTNPQAIAAVQISAILIAPIFISNPTLLPQLAANMVRLSIEYGNIPASTISYMSYGMLMCAFFSDVETGYRFGRVAIKLGEKLNAREFQCTNLAIFITFIQHRKESLISSIPLCKATYLTGIETSNFIYGGYAIANYFYYLLFAGVNINDWEPEIDGYCKALITINQTAALGLILMQKQLSYNLTQIVDNPDKLQGESYDETVMFTKHLQDNNNNALASVYVYKLMLAYLFGNYSNALDYIAKEGEYIMSVAGTVDFSIFHFYAALTNLALYPNQSKIEQINTLALVENYQENLTEWATHAPMNHQHKVDLIKAEKCRILGDNVAAMELYELAISGAKTNQFTHEEALSNELAAKFYLSWGREKIAQVYMQEAYYGYARWGAKNKINQLEQQYPQLLTPIFQKNNTEQITFNTLTKSSDNDKSWLDFPSIMQAAQTISQEIDFPKLLAKLLQITVTNAGAQTGTLIINQEQAWFVVAKVHQNDTETLHIPLNEYQELPLSLIYSVIRNQTTAVFDNLSESDKFITDNYISNYQPRSVLCTPISKQGKLTAILYLENNLTAAAFTKNRVEILQILTSQAAISLENARLYQKIEEYSHNLEIEVERKTEDLRRKAEDLQQTLKQLRQTQAQLIQSEKMSSLGQLVAGIAHEINNPVNFIQGNIKHTKNYVEDLIELLQIYQKNYPQPASEVEEKSQEIDLEFLLEDVTKILESMTTGSDRIEKIVQSLRNFSRLDESEVKTVDLHQGLESTLLILGNRLQATPEKPAIEIIKDYGKLPKISCYPSQLNQVFLNIINNAIDAIRQNQKVVDNPYIIITTQTLENKQICITITNNNSFISQEIIEKIFDPFFTTKPVGSGTGLGLFVSYSIIKQHQGNLKVTSSKEAGTQFEIILPLSN